jgi:hypothetical protein
MGTTVESALQAKTLVPSFTADDLQRSIEFYEGLGFAVEERWEDKGVLTGVMLVGGSVHIGLSQDDWQKGRDRKKGVGLRFYISTSQDIDDVAARARAAASGWTRSHTTRNGARVHSW